MQEFESILNTTHSPKEYSEYLKGNVSLYEIVQLQESLIAYNDKLQKEVALVNEWLNQSTVLLKERLDTPAA